VSSVISGKIFPDPRESPVNLSFAGWINPSQFFDHPITRDHPISIVLPIPFIIICLNVLVEVFWGRIPLPRACSSKFCLDVVEFKRFSF
jgi:hypothetical protein